MKKNKRIKESKQVIWNYIDVLEGKIYVNLYKNHVLKFSFFKCLLKRSLGNSYKLLRANCSFINLLKYGGQ